MISANTCLESWLMCLIVFNWQPQSDLPLQVWANRDEFMARPALATALWPEAPNVLAGRDLQGGGTWMGVTTQGRFAALTNVRDPRMGTAARSRGVLAAEYLQGNVSAAAFAHQVQAERALYGGFNLLLADADELWCVGSHQPEPVNVEPGWHGLSNAALNTPWPKLQRLLTGAQSLVAEQADSPEQHLALLADTEPAPDDALPDTGVGQIMERMLSPVCIRTPNYGTRNSTWLRVERTAIRWHELDWNDGVRRDQVLVRALP